MSIRPNQSPQSEWDKNWRNSIAVKITAPVFWVLTMVGLITATVVQNRFADNLPGVIAADADRVAFAISRYLLELEGGQPLELGRVTDNAMSGMYFIGGDINVGLRDVRVGQSIQQDGAMATVKRLIPYSNKLQSGDALIAELKLYHPPYSRIIKDQRKNFLLKYGAVLIAFGLLLAGLIHIMVTKPITKLLRVTKAISEGDMASRLDNDRQDEFGRLTELFNRMLDKLQNKQDELSLAVKVAESASSAKSAFLANMSHEIRTPLTALLGFSALLKDDILSLKEYKQHVESIIRAGNHLQQIINDILDMSKIEAGQLVIEKNNVSLVEVISNVDYLMRPYAEEKGLRFRVHYEFPLPGHFVTDATRLKQVLLNLCSNAIKFTNEGNIEIKVSFQRAHGFLQFDVIDTGVGMTKEELERLFTPFSQADISNTRRYGGTGLGLCICKELVISLGGDIDCQSRKGIGSRFQFTINPGKVPEENWISELFVEQNTRQLLETPLQPGSLLGKVLLAEDTLDNQKLISMYIQRAGASAIVVDNGKKALNKALTEDFDLILMDTQMPVMGGVEATVKLRTSGYDKPIVALTANALKEDQEQSRLAGVDDYLTKPVDVNRFNEVLKRYLKPISQQLQQPVTATNDNANAVTSLEQDPEFQLLLEQFERELPMKLEKIQSALNAENWQELRSQVHKLKGLGSSFGYPEISEIAAHIQNNISHGQYDGIGELTRQLYSSYCNTVKPNKLSSGC